MASTSGTPEARRAGTAMFNFLVLVPHMSWADASVGDMAPSGEIDPAVPERSKTM